MTKKRSIQTAVTRAGIESDTQHGAVTPPLYLTTNYTFKAPGDRREYDYARSGNPTRAMLGDALAEIESGAGAVVTASGMAGIMVPTHLLKQGELLIAPHDCYGGTYRLLNSLRELGYINVEFVDMTTPDTLEKAFAMKPKMALIETPSNPLLRLTDVEHVVKLAKDNGTITVADNTFMSPVFQRPIEQGIDIVHHSTTKFLNGHGDVIGGALISATDELHEKMAWWANNLGCTGGAWDSFLTLRGMRTLELRVKHAADSAMKIAEFLEGHPGIKTIHFPGLKSHPAHALANKQQDGHGTMISFEVDGGMDGAKNVCKGLELFSLAESLGGYESLINHPATMTHAGMAESARHEAGIFDNLLRLSIGLEDADDLIADLDQALSGAVRAAA